MIPKIYHLTTKSGLLNKNEQIILSKNKKLLGDEWEVKIYSDDDNLWIIKNYYPEFLERFICINKGVVKADIMRCIYMHMFGGIYSDTDYQFLRRLPEELMHFSLTIPSEELSVGKLKLCNCLFFSEPGNPFWYDFVDDVLNKINISTLSEDEIIPTSGPIGLTRFYNLNKEKYLEINIPEPITFFPLKHRWELFKKMDERTLGVHYCLSTWRNIPFLRRIALKSIQRLQVLGLNFR